MSKRLEEAAAILKEIKAAGIKPKLNGNWMEWHGNMPFDLFQKAMDYNKEIVELVRSGNE
jgi:hypothetical protein